MHIYRYHSGTHPGVSIDTISASSRPCLPVFPLQVSCSCSRKPKGSVRWALPRARTSRSRHMAMHGRRVPGAYACRMHASPSTQNPPRNDNSYSSTGLHAPTQSSQSRQHVTLRRRPCKSLLSIRTPWFPQDRCRAPACGLLMAILNTHLTPSLEVPVIAHLGVLIRALFLLRSQSMYTERHVTWNLIMCVNPGARVASRILK